MPSLKNKVRPKIGMQRRTRPQRLPDDQTFYIMFEGHAAIMLLIEPLTGKILDANQAAIHFYGYPKSRLCGMSIHEMNTLPSEQVAVELQKAKNQQRNYAIFPHLLASGEERIVEVYSSTIALQKKQVLFSVIHDITERKRAEESIRHRVMELETINRISLAMRGVSTQIEMLEIVLEEALAILNTAHGAIELYNMTSGNLDKTITRGWIAQVIEPPQHSSEGIAGKVLTSGEIYLAREFASDPVTRAAARSQIPPGWGGACLPIRTTQQTLGVLIVSVPGERRLDKDEIRLLSILSEMAGATLQRMQLYAETARRAEEFAALYQTSNTIAVKNDLNTLNLRMICWRRSPT